jgi:N-acetylneuraminate synthase
MNIAGREVGPCHPCFIVAEISCNHMGSPRLMYELVAAATEAGAGAVKVQFFEVQDITLGVNRPEYYVSWQGRRTHLSELYREAYTSADLVGVACDAARTYGVAFIQSAFACRITRYPDAIKIASAEIVDHDLLDNIGIFHRHGEMPIILSTGMATDAECVAAALKFTPGSFAMLHCVSEYPTKADHADLLRMNRLPCQIRGISDHSKGLTVPIAATALGANIIEKHIMLPGTHPLDEAFSLTPHEFRNMVQAVRETEQALKPFEGEPDRTFQRKLVYARDLPSGHVLTADDILVVRVTEGISGSRKGEFVGRTPTKDVEYGEPINP